MGEMELVPLDLIQRHLEVNTMGTIRMCKAFLALLRKSKKTGPTRFKRGFGGRVVKTPGAYDYVYNPFLYKLYRLYSAKIGS